MCPFRNVHDLETFNGGFLPFTEAVKEIHLVPMCSIRDSLQIDYLDVTNPNFITSHQTVLAVVTEVISKATLEL
jgi:hypothetical protein